MGATLRPRLRAPGFRSDRYDAALGTGDDVWQRAKAGIQLWAAHAGAGAIVFPPSAPISAGETVLVLLSVGLATVIAPCRIVAVVDDANTCGFAYGTLPGHPVQGEEAFIVTRERDGEVHFSIEAFSRPHAPLVRLAAPLSLRVQAKLTRRYLTGLANFCAEPKTSA